MFATKIVMGKDKPTYKYSMGSYKYSKGISQSAYYYNFVSHFTEHGKCLFQTQSFACCGLIEINTLNIYASAAIKEGDTG